ncbi:MAG: GNAT family N-acetyltransferase [Aggregatilineales bacterium]
MKIRPYQINDYPAVVAIRNRVEPEYPMSVEAFQRRYEERDLKCLFQMLIAENDDHPMIGYALYTQHADMYKPHVFWLKMGVLPEHQQRGVGTVLFSALMDDLVQHQPIELNTEVREDNLPTLKFAHQHGFSENARRWESRLDLPSADVSLWEGYDEKMAVQGIVLKSLADLADDPERDTKFYELHWQVDSDVPLEYGEILKLSMEEFRKEVLDNPNFVAEGTFVALDGDDYVGLSTFFKDEANNLYIYLTGTAREYRRRGIATAVKVFGIQYAKAHGYKTILTFNDAPNIGMIAINESLGFVRQPAWLIMKKTFKVEL